MSISGRFPASHEKNNDEIHSTVLHTMSTVFMPY